MSFLPETPRSKRGTCCCSSYCCLCLFVWLGKNVHPLCRPRSALEPIPCGLSRIKKSSFLLSLRSGSASEKEKNLQRRRRPRYRATMEEAAIEAATVCRTLLLLPPSRSQKSSSGRGRSQLRERLPHPCREEVRDDRVSKLDL